MKRLSLAVLLAVFSWWVYLGAPHEIANWYHAAALEAYAAGNTQVAIEHLRRAIEWSPEQPHHYANRSEIYQRQGRHLDAVRDQDRIVDIYRRSQGPQLSNALNGRAYYRALGQLELEEALDDVQKAIEAEQNENASFLDTRGYIYYLLDDLAAAEQDLARALELAIVDHARALDWIANHEMDDPDWRAMRRTQADHYLAVIYHHTGLVYGKLGNAELATDHLKLGDDLGYNPDEGVW